LTVKDYLALEEPACTRYELSEGELVVTPCPNFFHNKKRDRINARMAEFVDRRKLGEVVSEMDFRLRGETVRRPDVAFISAARLKDLDLEKVPLATAPDLAIKVVSENDRAHDLLVKVVQYLAAGTKAVWLFYPDTRLAYRYLPGKLEPEVRSASAGHKFEESELLPGFAFPLAEIFP
jgi:Uma2 family endonuclease